MSIERRQMSTGGRPVPSPERKPSGEFFPSRAKPQELRSGRSSNSLRFLTPGTEKIYPLTVSNVQVREPAAALRSTEATDDPV